MKTLEHMLNEYKFNAFDGRDKTRIMAYCDVQTLNEHGYKLNDGVVWEQKEWNEETILENLKSDLDFAFEKALDKRGISSACMYEVIKMWNSVLDIELPETYAQYGLPYFKATALHHGFENPIGDDRGDEYEYSAEADY